VVVVVVVHELVTDTHRQTTGAEGGPSVSLATGQVMPRLYRLVMKGVFFSFLLSEMMASRASPTKAMTFVVMVVFDIWLFTVSRSVVC
jgi:hypothetical protein